MPHPDRGRIVLISAPQGPNDTRPRVGSGYQVSATHVLTATHVLGAADTESIAVQSHAGNWVSGVTDRDDLDGDVSLVRLRPAPSPGVAAAAAIEPAPYGTFTVGGTKAAFAVGFPASGMQTTRADAAVTTAPYRDMTAVRGIVDPFGGTVQKTFKFGIDTDDVRQLQRDVIAREAESQGWQAPAEESQWTGMSGAALWVENRMVGIVTADLSKSGTAQLMVTRLDEVLRQLEETEPARALRTRAALGLMPGERLVEVGVKPELLLDDAEYRDLMTIFRNAPGMSGLGGVFRDATERQIAPPATDDLRDYIAELRKRVGAQPLFKFLIGFADVARHERTTDALNEWMARTAPRYDVDRATLQAIYDQSRTDVILVQLRPHMLADGWQVKSWTFTSGRRNPTAVFMADEPWGLDELGEWLGREITGLVGVGDFNPDEGTTRVTVEFQVTTGDFQERFEELPITIGGHHTAIGAVCPVVMRSLDRLEQREWIHSWQKRWRIYKERSHTYDDTIIHWIEAAAELDAAPSHVASVLAHSWDGWELTFLRTLLQAGTPVALWHRTEPFDDPRDVLGGIVHSFGLNEVPARVLRRRLDGDDSVRDLVLLWDDPDRIPKTQRYDAPRRQGVAS
jgi:hypothetical protein